MKTQIIRLLTVLALCASLHQAAAQGTAFTYQGRLNNNGNPANGLYDFTFTLWNDLSGGSQNGPFVTDLAVGVTNGLFTVTLDFGPGIFTGPSYWLQIAVEPSGVGPYITLSPRQPLMPAPYAIYAENAGGVNNASISAAQLNTVGAPGSGQVLEFNGSSLQWTTSASGLGGWSLTGNSGTTPGTDFLGTTDNNALEFHVNGARLFRLDPNGNVVGGYATSVDPSVTEATISGGYGNTVSANSGEAPTIGGGYENTVSNLYPTVSGGEYNHATANGAVVGGGYKNTASGGQATVAGGVENTASGIGAFIGGGAGNLAQSGWATVSGGSANLANGAGATVPGGQGNGAYGAWSFAAGPFAQAQYADTFIWGDGTQSFYDSGPNQFDVLATGGINFYPGNSNVSIASPAALAFGSSARQMISLYNDGTYQYGIGVQTSTLYERAAIGGGFAWYSGGVHNDGQFNNGGGATLMTLDSLGDLNVTAGASVCALTVRGGCDLAEPFEMSTQAVAKGSVVVIDDQHAGQLKLSERAYDTRVAGIVSGANGINPGIALHQDGAFQDGQNVALSGRVYVLADASSGPIVPGDLLTTSDTPGHAMKVTDHARAQGAILGKAMTGLKEGKGMVLVLVTLQ
jgi:hypothetical protein